MEHGFYEGSEVKDLAKRARLTLVLVRCGGGRFLCPAQDAEHFTACVAAGGDYVRDYSRPVS